MYFLASHARREILFSKWDMTQRYARISNISLNPCRALCEGLEIEFNFFAR